MFLRTLLRPSWTGAVRMAQMEVTLMHPIVRHQQPAGAALPHLREHVTRRGLHHLRDDDLHMAPDHVVERSGFRDFASEIFNAHAFGIRVWHLYQCFARCDGIGAEKRFNAKHPSSPTVAASTVV